MRVKLNEHFKFFMRRAPEGKRKIDWTKVKDSI